MKKIVVALLFLFAVVVESNAQIIGGGEYTQTTPQLVTTNNNTNGLIKAGVIVLSAGGGLGLLFTIIGGVLYGDTDGVLLWSGVFQIGVATAVGVPLLMAGKARQRRALAIQTTPIMNYDFKLNDHLTLSTNLNVMSKSNLSSTKSLKRDYCPGAGLVLHF